MYIGDTPEQLSVKLANAIDVIIVGDLTFSKKDIVALQAERDALAAHVECLRDAASEAAQTLGFLSNHLQGRMGEAALMDMAEKADALNNALAATPLNR